MKKTFLLILFSLLCAWLPAVRPDSAACVEHVWLYGVGRANVLDTYLSPMEYTGTSLGFVRRTERLARWGRGRVTVQGLFTGNVAGLSSPTDDGKEWDGQFSASFGWLCNWRPHPSLRLAAGGLAGMSTGFTYNTRNGNNPAQGRLSAELAASGLADYAFRVAGRPFSARLQLDIPLLGGMFTPAYGQSYYEIFSLGHYDHNVRLTHPFNAPSFRMLLTLNVPLGRATLSAGYHCDVRQSDVNFLKRHIWNNQFVIGYVRYVRLLPNPRR